MASGKTLWIAILVIIICGSRFLLRSIKLIPTGYIIDNSGQYLLYVISYCNFTINELIR